MFDIIIVGGGPSGMTAALYALRSSKTVLILEKESFGGQIATSPRVENFPTHQSISGLQLSDLMFEQIMNLGANFELECVTDIQKNNQGFIVSTNYHTYESKTVIIANGVKHRRMNLANEEHLIGKGISYCAVCDGAFYKGQETYVIGDANSALQYALMLANYCPKVHLFTLFDRFFSDDILQKRVLTNNKIEVKHNLNLISYVGETQLEGLTFQDTKTKEIINFKTNNVFIAIGQIPNNDMFKNLVDLDNGYIVVDQNMETKTNGLFAIGDTRVKQVRQLVTACNDGAIAAVSALKYLD